jgi:lysophospholipase L1-like esterase
MSRNKFLVGIYLMLFISICSFAQIKVACVGNSITYGATITNREHNSYPAQLDSILGEGWDVKNFGISGTTLLKNGDRPYWKNKAFTEAKEFCPDVVIIKLGTNDTKPQNWKFKNEYVADYTAMINEFKALPSKPVIFICFPVPAYPERWGIRDSIIRVDVIPMVKKVGKINDVKIIDLYKPLSNHAEWFLDKIHPNAIGAGEMAKVIDKVLVKNKKKIEKRKK